MRFLLGVRLNLALWLGFLALLMAADYVYVRGAAAAGDALAIVVVVASFASCVYVNFRLLRTVPVAGVLLGIGLWLIGAYGWATFVVWFHFWLGGTL